MDISSSLGSSLSLFSSVSTGAASSSSASAGVWPGMNIGLPCCSSGLLISSASAQWHSLGPVSYRRDQLCDMLWVESRPPCSPLSSRAVPPSGPSPLSLAPAADDNVPAAARLDTSIVAAAPYGGPIALLRNESILQSVRKSFRSELETFTAAGRAISSCHWPYNGLVCMEWTAQEELVCIFREGVARVFSALCELLHAFVISPSLRADGGVIAARVDAALGFLVVSAALNFFFNFSFKAAELVELPKPDIRGPPLALCILPPLPSPPPSSSSSSSSSICSPPREPHGGSPSSPCPPCPAQPPASAAWSKATCRVLVAPEQGDLMLLTTQTCKLLNVESGPIVSVGLSRSQQLLGCLGLSGRLSVFQVDSNLEKPMHVSTVESGQRPVAIAWCGDDCVALYTAVPTPSGDLQHVVYLGGPSNEWLPFIFDSPMVLVSEVDALRLVSATKSELLRRVAPSTFSIFALGSCDTAALLCYAAERLQQADVAAEESIRTIKAELPAATSCCIAAAAEELERPRVLGLLKAAALGRTFLDNETNTGAQFVRTCALQRISQAVRQAPLDYFLTVAQLEHLTVERLLLKLAGREFHLLAFRISAFSGSSPWPVACHWAALKIQRALPLSDRQLANQLRRLFVACSQADAQRIRAGGAGPSGPAALFHHRILNSTRKISYADVARLAAEAGRPHLACLLLEYENSNAVTAGHTSTLNETICHANH
eukprot:GHVT01076551.1.p1 GENE.GHVT01076551.1~~GHVT01076551.1.p1  ORF type:complete len:717 (-),score=212.93 GHVT01076551.1:1118-3268(-)